MLNSNCTVNKFKCSAFLAHFQTTQLYTFYVSAKHRYVNWFSFRFQFLFVYTSNLQCDNAELMVYLGFQKPLDEGWEKLMFSWLKSVLEQFSLGSLLTLQSFQHHYPLKTKSAHIYVVRI